VEVISSVEEGGGVDIQTEFNASTNPFLPSSFNKLTSNNGSLVCEEGAAIVLECAADSDHKTAAVSGNDFIPELSSDRRN
jgi:hypothetical protein